MSNTELIERPFSGPREQWCMDEQGGSEFSLERFYGSKDALDDGRSDPWENRHGWSCASEKDCSRDGPREDDLQAVVGITRRRCAVFGCQATKDPDPSVAVYRTALRIPFSLQRSTVYNLIALLSLSLPISFIYDCFHSFHIYLWRHQQTRAGCREDALSFYIEF
jgi:hypothetical protein